MAVDSKQKKKSSASISHKPLNVLRLASVLFLIFIGCFSLTMFMVAHWAENQVLDTNNWVAAVGPLPQQPQVNSALSSYITAQIFNNVPVQQEIANVLPPKAVFLASPLATQLHSLTTQVTQKVIASDGFETIWVTANRASMNQLVGAARGQRPPLGSKTASFNLNLSSIKSQLASKLGSAASALPTLNLSSGKLLNIRTNLKTKREHVWMSIRAIDLLSAVLPFVAAACFLGALALSWNRLKVTLIIAGIMIVLMLLELIAIKVLRQQIIGQVKNASYQSAVGYVFDSLFNSLKSFLIYGGILVWSIVFIICLLSGPYAWAKKLRKITRLGSIKIPKLNQWWHLSRKWALMYQYYIELGVGILLLVWLAFISNVSSKEIINGIMTAVSLVAIIYLLGHPRKLPSKIQK